MANVDLAYTASGGVKVVIATDDFAGVAPRASLGRTAFGTAAELAGLGDDPAKEAMEMPKVSRDSAPQRQMLRRWWICATSSTATP